MIPFRYSGDTYISIEEKEDAKRFFIEKLGPFKSEFEHKIGSVIVNFGVPPDSMKRYSFNVGQNYSLSDFIGRWNRYIQGIQ